MSSILSQKYQKSQILCKIKAGKAMTKVPLVMFLFYIRADDVGQDTGGQARPLPEHKDALNNPSKHEIIQWKLDVLQLIQSWGY